MSKKILKIVSISLAGVLGACILAVGGYLGYVIAQYYRIEDGVELEIRNNQERTLVFGEEYSVLSYNLGFGAYSPDYSFFMDEGKMKTGETVTGLYAKAVSASEVEKNVAGQISLAQEQNADFYLFQEIDEPSHRSYQVDMRKRIGGAFANYGEVYAQNFHTAYLLYPFHDVMGQANSGILTLSRYRSERAVRRSFPVAENLIDKLFDLDRCFSVQHIAIAGSEKRLALINLHMSAYDEGGTVRTRQLAMLNEVLRAEREAGNYVVAGGDFNHCLIADNFESGEDALAYFPSAQVAPDWVKNSVLRKSKIAEGYRICASMENATCRGADIPYQEGVSYQTVIDGFLVSDNIEVVWEGVTQSNYLYSDHNPVRLNFKLISE